MTTVFQLGSDEAYRIWHFAQYHNSTFSSRALLDAIEVYWQHRLNGIWHFFPIGIESSEETQHLPSGDLQLFLPDIPIMNQKALEVFKSVLSANGEFLPLASSEQKLYFYHLIPSVEALDQEHAQFRRSKRSGRISRITQYAFHKEVIQDQFLFKIPEEKSLFATNRFIQLIEEYQLTGLTYQPIWSDQETEELPS